MKQTNLVSAWPDVYALTPSAAVMTHFLCTTADAHAFVYVIHTAVISLHVYSAVWLNASCYAMTLTSSVKHVKTGSGEWQTPWRQLERGSRWCRTNHVTTIKTVMWKQILSHCCRAGRKTRKTHTHTHTHTRAHTHTHTHTMWASTAEQHSLIAHPDQPWRTPCELYFILHKC